MAETAFQWNLSLNSALPQTVNEIARIYEKMNFRSLYQFEAANSDGAGTQNWAGSLDTKVGAFPRYQLWRKGYVNDLERAELRFESRKSCRKHYWLDRIFDPNRICFELLKRGQPISLAHSKDYRSLLF